LAPGWPGFPGLFGQAEATKLPAPPGGRTGRKTVADLQDGVRRERGTGPRRTLWTL